MFRTLLKATTMILLGTLSLSAQNSTSATSSVPRLVNYSGKALDAQNKPLSGAVGITCAIYKDQEGGAALWMETQNVTADAKGSYTAHLGATKPDGLALDLFSPGEARWLGVSINGAPEQPRLLLLSVPHALKAADAETIGGLPPSAFLRADATASLKPPAKAESSSRSGQTKQSPQANPSVTGKGTVSFVPLWDSTSDIVNSSIFQKNANVGIGTTAPQSAEKRTKAVNCSFCRTKNQQVTVPFLMQNGPILLCRFFFPQTVQPPRSMLAAKATFATL